MSERPRHYKPRSESRAERPQEIKQVLLNNLRPNRFARLDEPKPPSWRSQRPGMDPGHLANIRKLCCTVCPARCGSDPHHLKSGLARGERGLFLKATDRWAIPLCRFHHADVERIGSKHERAWFGRWGVDPHQLAQALWGARGSLPQMGAILAAHKQQATRSLSRRAAVSALQRHGLTRAEAEETYDDGIGRRS